MTLAADLKRAGITPYGWVVNQSLAPTDSTDPILAERARRELPYIDEARAQTNRFALVPWQPELPVGPEHLANLVRAA